MKVQMFATFFLLSGVCIFSSPASAQKESKMPTMSHMKDSMAMAMDSNMEPSLKAVLSGDNAVPDKADPDGTGEATFTLKPDSAEICYTLWVKDIAKASAAHVHHAPAGKNGSVAVPLEAPASGSSEGCVHDVSVDLIKDILKSPGDYYVNVHNADYPGGAIRGQLSMPTMMGK